MKLSSSNYKYILVFLLAIGFLLSDATYAQQDESATTFLAGIQKAYHSAAYLGFRVKYLYTNAGGAASIDSLSGEMQMDKGRCRLQIDGTETVVTGKYVIQVMDEDKAIFLSSSGKLTAMDPIQMLDTVFKQLQGVHSTIVSEGRWKVMTLDFPPGRMYTSIRMIMDPGTGYFKRITYGIHTASLVGKDQIDGPGHPAPYQQEGAVDMLFSNYEHGRFDDTVFDEKNFFTHVAGRFEPSGRYRDYHIFLTSSHL